MQLPHHCSWTSPVVHSQYLQSVYLCCLMRDSRSEKSPECNQSQLYLHLLMLHIGNPDVKWTLVCSKCFFPLSFSVLSPPVFVRKGDWCQGGHPVLGARLPLSIPPDVMGRGLYGELSVQLVTLLSPCVRQYPNLPTQLTHIQISFAECIT